MINLDSGIKREIINALVTPDPESRQLYLQSIKNVAGVGTQNSRGKHGWDFRYNSIIDIANRFGLKYIKIGRKLWEAVLLLGPENEVFVFFSEPNLKRIIRDGKRNHYLKLLNLFNEELDAMKPLNQQLTLFAANESGDNDDYLKLAQEMLYMMETEPSKVIVIAFDTSITATAKAYSFNTKHELVWEENLNEYIDVNHHMVLKDDNIKPGKRESTTVATAKKEKRSIVRLKGV